MSYQYNTDFMSYADHTSRLAAETVVAMLQGWSSPASVLDVGCAKGTWLSVWADAGVGNIHGVDGDYVDRKTLAIPGDCFSAADLSRGFDLSQRFDLVQSLE
ncbi:MAG: methyltransferase domain-containing protein, partial [Rhodanobacteraceae bacterium]